MKKQNTVILYCLCLEHINLKNEKEPNQLVLCQKVLEHYETEEERAERSFQLYKPIMKDILRLPKEGVEQVLRKGGVIHSPFFSIKFVKQHLKVLRFAFVVSKKLEKTAVRRNYIKRRLRGIFENMFKNKGFSVDVVILIKKKLDKGDYEVISEAIKDLNF